VAARAARGVTPPANVAVSMSAARGARMIAPGQRERGDMRVAWVAMAAGVMVTATAAESQARIRLDDAQIMAGVLVVGGWTQSRGAAVGLDGKFSTTSDSISCPNRPAATVTAFCGR
jgi:hypothetical protein